MSSDGAFDRWVDARLDRRGFLGLSGFLSGVLAAGGTLALVAPSPAWAEEIRTLTAAEAATLLAMARTLAPHDGLEEAAYGVVVKAVDGLMGADAGTATLVRDGLAALGAGFAGAAEAARVGALQAIEHGPFFGFIRAQTLFNLYTTPLAYAHFGYEGEAFSKGGYLARGFDELDWLPEVPLEDAGPNPLRPAGNGGAR